MSFPLADYLNIQKKTLSEIEAMKRKMELVDLGIPLGLICPVSTSDKAMPTKAMPPIKSMLLGMFSLLVMLWLFFTFFPVCQSTRMFLRTDLHTWFYSCLVSPSLMRLTLSKGKLLTIICLFRCFGWLWKARKMRILHPFNTEAKKPPVKRCRYITAAKSKIKRSIYLLLL